jgi:hypothetical protein
MARFFEWGGVGVVDGPEAVVGGAEGAGGAGVELVAEEEDEVGADGGVGVEVVVIEIAEVGDLGVDDLDGFGIAEGFEFFGGEGGGFESAEAGDAAGEPGGEAEGFVLGADVEGEAFGDASEEDGEDFLDDDINIDVGGGEDECAELEDFAGVTTAAVDFEVKGEEGVDGGAGAAAVGDDVDFLDVGAGGDEADHLLEVEDGELAGGGVVLVAAEEAFTAGGPGVGDGDTLSAEEVPEAGDGFDGVVEGVVEAVDEEIDLFDGGECELGGELMAEGVFGLEFCGVVVVAEHGDFAGHGGGGVDLDEDGGGGLEAAKFGGFGDGVGEVEGAKGGAAGLDEVGPGDVVAEVDLADAEGDGAGAFVAVEGVGGGRAFGDAVGEIEDVDVVVLQSGGDIGEGVGFVPDVEVGGGHEGLAGAGGEEEGGGEKEPMHDGRGAGCFHGVAFS